jgi:hypothetical protein
MAGNFYMKLFTDPELHYQLQCYSDIHQFSAQNAFLFTQSFPVIRVAESATVNDFSRLGKGRFIRFFKWLRGNRKRTRFSAFPGLYEQLL